MIIATLQFFDIWDIALELNNIIRYLQRVGLTLRSAKEVCEMRHR